MQYLFLRTYLYIKFVQMYHHHLSTHISDEDVIAVKSSVDSKAMGSIYDDLIVCQSYQLLHFPKNAILQLKYTWNSLRSNKGSGLVLPQCHLLS